MNDELNLSQAADVLAERTGKSHFKGDELRIIRAGAEGHIPVFWRNSAQVWTRLSNFKGDLWKTDSCSRWMQIHPHDLSRLETAMQTDVLDFALTDQDRALLGSTPQWEASPGETPPGAWTDELGGRHLTEVAVFRRVSR